MKKLLVTLLLSSVMCCITTAATLTAAGGNWNTAGSWSPAQVPADGDDLVIPAGISVTLSSVVTRADLTLIIAGTLSFEFGFFTQGELILTGNSGVRVDPPGNFNEIIFEVAGFQLEHFSTIQVNGEVVYAACEDDPDCTANLNARFDPDPTPLSTGDDAPAGVLLLPTTPNPLPVEYLFFKLARANSNSVRLEWATATEITNEKFEVERSENGSTFQKIGEVEGNGDSDRRIDYSFIDNLGASKRSKILYYRLKQIDYDGQFEYSNTIVTYNLTLSPDDILVSPNPFINNLSIALTSKREQTVKLDVYDIEGKNLVSQKLNIPQGAYKIVVDEVGDLLKGMYILELRSNNSRFRERIVKVD